MKLLPSLLAAVCLIPAAALAPAPTPVAAAQDPAAKAVHLTFGVYQTDKATEMYKQFTPLLEKLQDDVTAKLGRPVDIELRIFRTYDDGITALVDGSVDFVHIGPASYITAKGKKPELRLLAMEHENEQKRFKGVIVVAKNSPIKSLAELKGHSFAFGDKNSTIGRFLVQAELVKNGIHASDLSGFKYLDRHDQVAAAVEHGDFDAGSVKFSTFQKANEKGTLRGLAEFWNVTKPLVARANLDDATFVAIQQALFELKDPAVLKSLKISGFMASTDSDYDFVREGMKKSLEFDAVQPARQPER
jgi:phosphonate transport system substrate-binding protein